MSDTVDYESVRNGTTHEESVIGDRAFCEVCGFITRGNSHVDRDFHGDSFEED